MRGHYLRRAKEHCYLDKKRTRPNKKLAPSIKLNKDLVASLLKRKKTSKVILRSFGAFYLEFLIELCKNHKF